MFSQLLVPDVLAAAYRLGKLLQFLVRLGSPTYVCGDLETSLSPIHV
jgi:hypothetical protein